MVALVSLMASRAPSNRCSSAGSGNDANGNDDTPSQNSRSRSTRRSGTLPAMSAALIAPIEMPAIQCGVCRIAASVSNTPAWYAPSAPPPCSTRMHSSRDGAGGAAGGCAGFFAAGPAVRILARGGRPSVRQLSSVRSSRRSRPGQISAPGPELSVAWRACSAPVRTISGLISIRSPCASVPPAWARICTAQAVSKAYMDWNAAGIVLPTVSRPWLRSIRKVLSPRSATSRGFSSSRRATPS